METAEAKGKVNGGRRIDQEQHRPGSKPDQMIVPHDTLLLSHRFAIPHHTFIARRGPRFHFVLRYPTSVVVCDEAEVCISLLTTSPTHQPGGQNSGLQDRILLARLIFLSSVLFSVTELGSYS